MPIDTHSYRKFKYTSDSLYKDYNAQFTTVPFKALSDHVWIKNQY